MKAKESRELVAIRDTADAALRKVTSTSASRAQKATAARTAALQARSKAGPKAAPTLLINPHGDHHASAVFLGSKPQDVPSALIHGIAVHHAIPDEPTGAVRNPKRDHDAPDIVTTIEAAFNLIPDESGALEIDIYPVLHDLVRPTKGSIFVSGSYVACHGDEGFGNETEANKFADLVSGVCCEALEATLSYVGDINGISGELAAAAFTAGSSQLMTGIPRPSDLQTMMSYPGAKSCEATQTLHMNLPHSEFSTGPFASTSGLIVSGPSKTPYDGGTYNWSGCEHKPEKMTAPSGSAPFAFAEGALFTTGGNYPQLTDPLTPLNRPQIEADYNVSYKVYPPAKFDVLPVLRVVGGNLSTGTQGSWLLKVKACYTGTVISHVGEMYHGASANISNAVTTNAPRSSTFAKTAAILNKVGAGASTADVSTASKASSLASSIANGASRVGKFLFDTLGGWSGIASKAASAASLLTAAL